MSVENIAADDPAAAAAGGVGRSRSKASNPLLWLQLVVFLGGLGLLWFVVYKIGFHTIVEKVRPIGWGFLIIVFLNGARHLIRSWCLYLALPHQHRSFKFRYAVAARLGGEAVSLVTFTGPFLGEAAKAALLKRNVPLSHGGAAVVVDNILYYISVILMILTGVGVMSYAYRSAHSMQYILIGVAAVGIVTFIGMGLLAWFKVKPIGFLIRRLSRRNLAPKFIEKRLKGINEIENNVHEFYETRRKTFFAIFSLNVLSHALSVVEVFSVLKMLGLPSNFTVAFIIESLTKVINFTFSFIPGAVGVYESGNEAILHALGYATATGVAVALVRRGAILFWTSAGLGILLWRTVTHSTKRLSKHITAG